MLGILCEKPSAARNFAKALGGMQGSYNQEDYKIVNALGHLYEYKQPHEMVNPVISDKYKSWNINNLPWNEHELSWKRVATSSAKPILANIKNVLSMCSEIVIATDVDPTGEGELLAYEIIEELGLAHKKISRMYFIDESVPEIQNAFVKRKCFVDFYNNPDYKKALFRTKFDYLTMQFTRIATTCGDGHSIVRQGRLKSAMVKLVGDQLRAVSEYKKVPFYSRRFIDENGNEYIHKEEKLHLFPMKEQVADNYTQSAVIVDNVEQKYTPPKQLLDLASLSAILSEKGYKAKQVLEVYQKMYEDQIVSYPRTEDKFISPEQFNELLPYVDKIAAVVDIDKRLLTHRTPRSTHVKTGGSHGANRPGLNVPQSLVALSSYGACAAEIYSLLAKSYLAMLAEDYVYNCEQGHLERYPDYRGKVNISVRAGWKQVFNIDTDEVSDNCHLGKLATPFVHEGFPPKPSAPTMKWLMKQLEKHDVGTGATRTSTYADVTSEKSKYPLLIDKKGKISMADCGEISYKLLPNTHIGSLSLTEEMQRDMRDIASGKIEPDACLSKIQTYVSDDLAIMMQNGKSIQKGTGNMTEKEKYEGMWNGKLVKFNRVWGGYRFTDEECEALLGGQEISIHGLKSKNGNTYGVKGRLSDMEYNGHSYVGFDKTGFADTKPGTVPDAWCGHVFTSEEKSKLLGGESIYCKNLKSKAGKLFNATLTFDFSESKIVPMFV